MDLILIRAAERGSLKDVQEYILRQRVNVNCQDENGRTPILVASLNGHTELVQFLLEHNADPNIRDKSQCTPIYRASIHGHTDVVRLLLKHNADPNIYNESYWAPLHIASNKGHTETVQLLLDHEANPNINEDESPTPLYEASCNGHTEVVQLLLEHGAGQNIQSVHSEAPMVVASARGHTEIVQLLLKHGGDPNIGSEFDNEPPLLAASRSGHTELVQILIEHGADPNISDEDGVTPLHEADNEEIAKYLVKHGANISALTTEDGNSVLHTACESASSSSTNLLIYFIEAGLSLDAINKSGQTPIDILELPDEEDEVSQWRKDCLRQLIAKGYYEEPKDPREATSLKQMKGEILMKLTDAASTLGTQPRGIIYVFAMTEGARVDLATITNTFEKDLKFAVYPTEDISGDELATLIKAAATVRYPVPCKHRCFYFAGQGGVQDKRPFFKPPNKDDEEPFFIHEKILVHFEKKKAQPDDKFIFFFDCSMGHEFGGFSLEAPAQCLIAHATSIGDTEKGGQWTSTLCEHLKEQVELGEALAKTHDAVMEVSDGRQTSQFTSRIGPVYLNGVASEKNQVEKDALNLQLKEKDEEVKTLETRIDEEVRKSELIQSEKEKEKAALQQEMERKITDINRTIEQKDKLMSQLTFQTAEKDLAYERLKQDKADLHTKLEENNREIHETKQQLTDELKALEKRITDEIERYKLLQEEKNMVAQKLKDMVQQANRLKVDDLCDVMVLTAHIMQDQWEELGRVLRVPSSELERIKSMNYSLTRSHYQTLRYWIVRVGGSWKGLVDALKHKEICQKDLAEEINRDHVKISQKRKHQMVFVKDRKLIKKYDDLLPYDIFAHVDWKVLGMILGLVDDTLEQIDDTNTDGNKAARVMMDEWISTGQPYWSILVDALESDIFDETDELANQIAKNEMGIDMQARGDDDGNLTERTYEINETKVEEMKGKILKKFSDASNTLPSQPKGIVFAFAMTEVKGARVDLTTITDTFEKDLKFAVYPVENISGVELANLIKAAATYNYPTLCKHRVLYFAGHGGIKDNYPFLKVAADKEGGDGERFFIRENILAHFGKKDSRNFIFFFDCCLSQSSDDKTPAEVGFSLEAPVRCLIAYATAVGIKSFGDIEKGGRWTSTLCEHLKEQVELGEALAKTHDAVMKLSNDTQPPQHRSCIGPVYLKGMPKQQVSVQASEEESKNILRRYRSDLFETLRNDLTDLTRLATALSMDGIIDHTLEDEIIRKRGNKEVVGKFLDKLEEKTDKHPTCLPRIFDKMEHFDSSRLCVIAQVMRKEATNDKDLAVTTDLFQDLNQCKTENEVLKQRLVTLETEKKQQEQALTNLKNDTSLTKWKENLIAMIQELN